MPSSLTSDNYYLSRPNSGLVHGGAVDCTDLPPAIASYVRASLAENTRRAYQSDLRHFGVWGGPLPASPETIAAYLAAHADCLSVTTLIRRLASLSKAHQARGSTIQFAQSSCGPRCEASERLRGNQTLAVILSIC
jgi:hypothetical protein